MPRPAGAVACSRASKHPKLRCALCAARLLHAKDGRCGGMRQSCQMVTTALIVLWVPCDVSCQKAAVDGVACSRAAKHLRQRRALCAVPFLHAKASGCARMRQSSDRRAPRSRAVRYLDASARAVPQGRTAFPYPPGSCSASGFRRGHRSNGCIRNRGARTLPRKGRVSSPVVTPSRASYCSVMARAHAAHSAANCSGAPPMPMCSAVCCCARAMSE